VDIRTGKNIRFIITQLVMKNTRTALFLIMRTGASL